MSKLNGKRILLGGLVAGLVLIISDVIPEFVIGSPLERWFHEMQLPIPGEGPMILLTLLAFPAGILIVWLYAVLTSHYGAGPKTAVITGVTVWTLNCLLPNVVMNAFGALSAGLFWYFTLHDFVALVLAAMAGARMYREVSTRVEVSSATTGFTAG